jgi:hypothetical protein
MDATTPPGALAALMAAFREDQAHGAAMKGLDPNTREGREAAKPAAAAMARFRRAAVAWCRLAWLGNLATAAQGLGLAETDGTTPAVVLKVDAWADGGSLPAMPTRLHRAAVVLGDLRGEAFRDLRVRVGEVRRAAMVGPAASGALLRPVGEGPAPACLADLAADPAVPEVA